MSDFLYKGAKKALGLVQNKLGIYLLKDWNKEILGRHFSGIYGIYIIENTTNNKLLIGEGNIGRRIGSHLNGTSQNKVYQSDFKDGHKFRMIGYIPCDNIEERKELEFYLHKYYKDSYNKPVPPKHLVIRMHTQGKTKKEIIQLLNCGSSAVDNNIKVKKTSEKLVYFKKDKNAWVSRFLLGNVKNNPINYELGQYDTETKAAQNRDYFIIHKGFLDKSKLNYYDIDYGKFKPHLMRNGKMNQHIKEIYDEKQKYAK